MAVQQLIAVEGWDPQWRWLLLPVSLLILVGAGVIAGYWPATPARRLPDRPDAIAMTAR
jgi:hypothetical protein